MNNIQLSGGPIALLAEGNSEANYLNILLDADKLLFTKEDLVLGRVLPQKYRNGKKFQDEILTLGFDTLDWILVQDNDNVPKIGKAYQEKITQTIKVITTPEIEMLVIHHFGFYQDWNKARIGNSNLKPSKFIADRLGTTASKVKSEKFIQETFTSDSLIAAIEKYSQNSSGRYREYELLDILRR